MSKLHPLKLPYGVKNGKLIHVSLVESGKKCGCTSPLDEGTPLVARKGEKNREHFATRSSCVPGAAYETVFHRLAKEVLSDTRSLLVPSIELALENRVLTLQLARVVENAEVGSERRIRDSAFTADSVLALSVQGARRELIVEWVVTHPCEQEKIEFLRARRVPSIEIEVGLAAESLSPERVGKWMLFEAPRKWIWHPLFEWADLRRRGLALVRKPTYRAVRFFKTRAGTKAVTTIWVKDCPLHGRIISIPVCRGCPYAYYVEHFQGGYVDCLFGSAELLMGNPTGKRLSPDAVSTDPHLWYERATPNLGSGFRVGWDKPRSDLEPSVSDELKKGPFAEPPRIDQ